MTAGTPALVREYPRFFFEFIVVDAEDWQAANGSRSRYAAGYMFSHPQLALYKHVIRMEPEVEATGPWQKDPFAEMALHNRKIGYWLAHANPANNTAEEATLSAYAASQGASLKSPKLMYDEGNQWQGAYINASFLAVETKAFRTPEYRDFFKYMAFVREEQLYAMYAALALNSTEDLEFINYVSVTHIPR